MSKKLTIDEIAERSGESKKTVIAVLDHLSDTVEAGLRSGVDVVLPGIGKLEIVATKPRQGRNPRTGETVQIPASKKVKFIVAGNLKKAVAA